MWIVTTQSFQKRALPSARSLRALDVLNFFIAATLAGFGPFVSLFLGERGWSKETIGFALSIGGIAALLSQLPGGELLDVVRSRRALVALGIVAVGFASLLIAFQPTFPMVSFALALEGICGGLIGPAIASISLGLVGHGLLGNRLGRNQRFQSIGVITATGLMGATGYLLSGSAIFLTSAALVLPTLFAIKRIRARDIHFGRSVGAPDHHHLTSPPRAPRQVFWRNPQLIIFASSLFLFQMANASMLPLVGATLGQTEGSKASAIVSGLIIVPQILVVLAAPWAGHFAQSWGRRPLLVIGFGALPIRAFLFMYIFDPKLLMAAQVLDGVSASVLGILQPLIIADVTNGTGRFNSAQGLVGVIVGIGASLSTTVSGLMVGNFGRSVGFLALALIGLAATIIAWLFMSETRLAN